MDWLLSCDKNSISCSQLSIEIDAILAFRKLAIDFLMSTLVYFTNLFYITILVNISNNENRPK